MGLGDTGLGIQGLVDEATNDLRSSPSKDEQDAFGEAVVPEEPLQVEAYGHHPAVDSLRTGAVAPNSQVQDLRVHQDHEVAHMTNNLEKPRVEGPYIEKAVARHNKVGVDRLGLRVRNRNHTEKAVALATCLHCPRRDVATARLPKVMMLTWWCRPVSVLCRLHKQERCTEKRKRKRRKEHKQGTLNVSQSDAGLLGSSPVAAWMVLP